MFPDKRVFSFEANPNCEKILSEQGIEYLICLLGNENKEGVKFYINPDDVTSTGSSIYKEKTIYFENSYTIDVPMYRLDDVVPVDANLNFLKMDVQGAELDVLSGATKLIPYIKWIYLEVSFVSLNAGAPLFDDVYMNLRNFGYRIIDECDSTYVDNKLVQNNYLFERA
jgi:FkbM family methyltransferase